MDYLLFKVYELAAFKVYGSYFKTTRNPDNTTSSFSFTNLLETYSEIGYLTEQTPNKSLRYSLEIY